MSSGGVLEIGQEGPVVAEAPEARREDAALLGRLRRGDPDAFELLVRTHQDRLYDFCVRMVGDREEAHDLVQEGRGLERAEALAAKLRAICDPEGVDAQAKASQRAWAERWGGREAVAAESFLVYTPPPGHQAEIKR